MDHFVQILSQVLVLFLLLLAGFVCVRSKVFNDSAIKGMTSLIIKLTLPAMILDSMLKQDFSPALMIESGLILLISFVIYAVLIALAIPFGHFFKANPLDIGVYRFVLVFSNVGFMGFPVVHAVFGPSALFYAAIFNLPFNLLVFTAGVLLLVKGHDQQTFKLSWKHLFSPVIVSIVLGFVFFLSRLSLPNTVLKVLELCGSITTPLSMIVVGGMLGAQPLRNVFFKWQLYLLSFLRLLVWPLAVYATLRLITDNTILAAVPAIITAMPAAANTALLAHEYQANASLASQAVFMTTLLSVVTIPLIAALIALW